MNFIICLAFVWCVVSVSGLPIDSSENESEWENSLEDGGNYEGDIILTKDQFLSVNGSLQKNGISGSFYRWPKKIIPYVLPNTFNNLQKSIIIQSMNTIQSRTCITFKPRTTELDFILFQTGSGCSSYVGHIGGSQPVTLGNGCVTPRIVMHELTHAIGFLHMQSSADRDKYIVIHWNNIRSGAERNFAIYRNSISYNLPYDKRSIMHYNSYAFSTNQKPTITSLDGSLIAQTTSMTLLDIQRIRKMYQC